MCTHRLINDNISRQKHVNTAELGCEPEFAGNEQSKPSEHESSNHSLCSHDQVNVSMENECDSMDFDESLDAHDMINASSHNGVHIHNSTFNDDSGILNVSKEEDDHNKR